jgi:hypothetical protein
LKEDLSPNWSSTLCFDARFNAAVLRRSLEELGYTFERDKEEKHYTRMMVIIPFPQYAYVFKFKVTTPERFDVLLYDTKPNHGGILHHIEIKDIDQQNLKAVKKLMKRFARNLKRKPYKFFLSERIRTGLITPEFLTSKSHWKRIGVS